MASRRTRERPVCDYGIEKAHGGAQQGFRMNEEQWTAVDGYITNTLLSADPVLEAALKNSADGGLPAINVTPNQGKLLQLLAQAQGARNILEVGTLGGYSTIWLGRALPPGG